MMSEKDTCPSYSIIACDCSTSIAPLAVMTGRRPTISRPSSSAKDFGIVVQLAPVSTITSGISRRRERSDGFVIEIFTFTIPILRPSDSVARYDFAGDEGLGHLRLHLRDACRIDREDDAEAHVERTVHLFFVDPALFLDQPEDRRRAPGAAVNHGA